MVLYKNYDKKKRIFQKFYDALWNLELYQKF